VAVFSEANARAGKTQASSVLIGILCALCMEECLGTSLSGSPQRFLDAERCFKCLKDARSQKRTRLTLDRSKKQATLMVHHSQMNDDAKKAALKMQQCETTGDWTPEFKDLEEEDFFSLGCDKLGRKIEAQLMPERAVVFQKNFSEDWEMDIKGVRSSENQARLLAKCAEKKGHQRRPPQQN